MRYLYGTIIATFIAMTCFYFVPKYFLPNYADLFNFNFAFGMFFGGFVGCSGLYFFIGEYDFVNQKAMDYDSLKNELDENNVYTKRMKAELEKYKYGSYLLEQFEKSQINCSRSHSKYIVDELYKLNNLQTSKFQAALEELKNLPPAESVQKTLDQQKNALIAARQERGLIKDIASKIFFQNNQSVWEYIAKELHAAKSRQPLPEKTFTPSAPTKGPRANKYKQYW